MYKICKTEQSAARQRELENTLLKEMQLRHFEDISIRDLCDRAGIPRKAFYRYFSGKNGAFHALIDHTLMDFENSILHIEPEFDPFQRKQLEYFLLFWKNNRHLLDAVEHSGLWTDFAERVAGYAIAELERSHKYTAKSIQEDSFYSVLFSTGGVMSVIHEWYRRGFSADVEQLAGLISRTLAPGMGWNP